MKEENLIESQGETTEDKFAKRVILKATKPVHEPHIFPLFF